MKLKTYHSPQDGRKCEYTTREGLKGESQSRAESILGEVKAGSGFESRSVGVID